jgi:hypothetical protein
MRRVIRSAQLRVYVPKQRVGAFPPHLDRARAVVRVSDEFVWEGPTSDDAYATTWDGIAYVCPRYPRLRMLEGVVAHRDAHPGSLLTSELAARRAAQEIDRIRASAPTARSYILTAPWHVPLRWFALFDPGARELLTTDAGPTIRYRNTLRDAIERIARAVEILEEAGFDEAVVEEAQDLERWLDGFSSLAMIELHYHSVARLFSDGDLAFDESCADVARSLAALERLDYEEAGRAYAEVAGRWAPAQALIYVN